MPLWRRRREKPLHEQLAEGTGLLEWQSTHDRAEPLFKGTLDVLHGGRQRRWEVVATAEAPELDGDELEFVALPDGTLLVDETAPEGALTPLAEALEQSLRPPYRAVAVRREAELWGVAANSIEVVELEEDVPGDAISLSMRGDERTLLVDERPGWASIPALERLAAARHDDYVLRAERLDGNLWTVEINPL